VRHDKIALATTAFAFLLLPAFSCAEQILVQDFEKPFEVPKWPPKTPGAITFSTEWKADGNQSLRIDPGLMAAFSRLINKNWKGASVLRIHAHNPTGQTATISFELQDQHRSFRERHQNAFGLAPGTHVIEMDISAGLWRGEENRPYRGKIKTPINTTQISRIAFANQGKGPIYIDKIVAVKVERIQTTGGFAFDFGKAGTKVMAQMTGVFHDTKYNPQKGYGMVGARPSVLGKAMSFPTPMFGDSLGLNSGGFRVNLSGGNYIAWIAFERGGFWGDEFSGYSSAELQVNGATVHRHEFAPSGPDFFFQDTELPYMFELVDALIWPAHAVHRFKFKAARGGNTFTLRLKDQTAYPLRIAGLILAPDTPEGKRFIDAHEQFQRKVAEQTYTGQDRGRREGRRPPSKSIVVEPLSPGHMMYPRDWPSVPAGKVPEQYLAVRGQKISVHLGIYSDRVMDLEVDVSDLSGPKELPASEVSHGRYLPMRPYGVGAVWLEVNHYRPGRSFLIGPNLSRSLLVEYEVPSNAQGGNYRGQIQIRGGGSEVTVPIKARIVPADLETIPIPVGLFMNALPVDPKFLDSETWWRLQESLLKEQMAAGLTALSGGPGIQYQLVNQGGKMEFRDGTALRYVRMAQKYGTVKAVVAYGGFFGGMRNTRYDPKAYTDAWMSYEKANRLPPHFANAYDEPSTAPEKKRVLGYLQGYTKAGLRTMGFTSWHGNDPLWTQIADNTYAPAFNIHTAENLQQLKAKGRHPWVYNNGKGRLGMGLRIWRSMKLGAEGRMEWIGLFTQGFAFYNLDGREPSKSNFLVHSELGVLKTPLWLSNREGLLDLRLRLTLEKLAQANDPVLKMWNVEGYRKDAGKWTEERFNKARTAMIRRIEELMKK